MKRAINRWRVEDRGAQTLVTTFAEVELKGGIFARLLEPLFAAVARRMGSRSLGRAQVPGRERRALPGQRAEAPAYPFGLLTSGLHADRAHLRPPREHRRAPRRPGRTSAGRASIGSSASATSRRWVRRQAVSSKRSPSSDAPASSATMTPSCWTRS